jgi:hypothetical protein
MFFIKQLNSPRYFLKGVQISHQYSSFDFVYALSLRAIYLRHISDSNVNK